MVIKIAKKIKVTFVFFGLISYFILPFGCQKESKSEVNFTLMAKGDLAFMKATLTKGVLDKKAVKICTSYVDLVGSLTESQTAWLEKSTQLTKVELQEWLSKSPLTAGTKVTVQARQTACPSAFFQDSTLNVFLYWNEQKFMARFGYKYPTLAVTPTDDKSDSIVVNLAGMMQRDMSKGTNRSTIISHEIGHALGLYHETAKPSVMAISRTSSNARKTITSDDIAGFLNILDRISGGAKIPVPEVNEQTEEPAKATAPAPLSQPVGDGECLVTAPAPEDFKVSKVLSRFSLANSTAFKRNTSDSTALPEACKCTLGSELSLKVELASSVLPASGHVQVKLTEGIAGCEFGKAGTVGYIFAAHWQDGKPGN